MCGTGPHSRLGGRGCQTGAMCGRYAQTRADDKLARDLMVQQTLAQVRPSWNVAPTQQVPVIVERDDGDATVRQLRTVRWGLVPSWARDVRVGSRMINARAETIVEKPAYRKAATRRRALVPMDGYFEWQPPAAGQKRKTPFYLHAPDGAPLVAAGLYELWRDPDRGENDPDRWVWSVTVVTTDATDTLGRIHDRSPLLLPPDMWGHWLDPTVTDPHDVVGMVTAVPEPHLVPRQVGYAVGNVRNDHPGLVDEVQSDPGDG